MNQRKRGASLVETLVVVSIFGLLMSLVLGFYIYGTRVTANRDRSSEAYRRVATLLDRLETVVGAARVYYVDDHQIVFSTLPESQSWGAGAWPNFEDTATTLGVFTDAEGRFIGQRRSGQTSIWRRLGPEETVTFGGGPNPSSITVQVTVNLPALPQGGGEARSLQLSRTILVEQF